MKIAVTLVHNKSDKENEAQIKAVLALVDKVVDTNVDQETGAEFLTNHYEFKDFGIPHEVNFYHIVPYGINRPSNLDQLDGHKVIYGSEFQMNEKTFFDWGLKRGTDHGADVSIYVEDINKLNFKQLLPKFEKIKDKQDPTEFLQESGAKIANVEYIKKGGLK